MEVESKKPAAIYPQIQNYRCYRRFLIDFYNYKKDLRSGFSYRRFSSLAGFKSPNYLQLVMKGERNLSSTMAVGVAEALGLKAQEKNYFLSLVKQENAISQAELLEAQKEGLASLKKLVSKQIPSVQSEILSQWCNLLVRELTFFQDFEATPEYVTHKTGGIINQQQAEKALGLLIKGGFIKHVQGRWISEDPVLDTGDDIFTRESVQRLHAETLKVWSQRITQSPVDFQELGLINIPITAAKIPELRNKMRTFQDEIIGWLQAEKNPDSLVQLGVYLIPIVTPNKRYKF